jgi:hypothetical protein
VAQHIFTVLESRQHEGPSPRHLLPVLSKIMGLAPGTFQEGTRPLPRGLLYPIIPTITPGLGCDRRQVSRP